MTKEPNLKKYDLIERTAKFGEDIIKFCKKVPRGPITDPLIVQLVKAVPVQELIIVKQMMQKVRRTLSTKLVFVKKNPGNQSTSLE